jgi:hypothetical protein
MGAGGTRVAPDLENEARRILAERRAAQADATRRRDDAGARRPRPAPPGDALLEQRPGPPIRCASATRSSSTRRGERTPTTATRSVVRTDALQNLQRRQSAGAGPAPENAPVRGSQRGHKAPTLPGRQRAGRRGPTCRPGPQRGPTPQRPTASPTSTARGPTPKAPLPGPSAPTHPLPAANCGRPRPGQRRTGGNAPGANARPNLQGAAGHGRAAPEPERPARRPRSCSAFFRQPPPSRLPATDADDPRAQCGARAAIEQARKAAETRRAGGNRRRDQRRYPGPRRAPGAARRPAAAARRRRARAPARLARAASKALCLQTSAGPRRHVRRGPAPFCRPARGFLETKRGPRLCRGGGPRCLGSYQRRIGSPVRYTKLRRSLPRCPGCGSSWARCPRSSIRGTGAPPWSAQLARGGWRPPPGGRGARLGQEGRPSSGERRSSSAARARERSSISRVMEFRRGRSLVARRRS